MTGSLERSFRIAVAVIFPRSVGLADGDGLAESVDGLEAALGVAEADGLRKDWVALELAREYVHTRGQTYLCGEETTYLVGLDPATVVADRLQHLLDLGDESWSRARQREK